MSRRGGPWNFPLRGQVWHQSLHGGKIEEVDEETSLWVRAVEVFQFQV